MAQAMAIQTADKPAVQMYRKYGNIPILARTFIDLSQKLVNKNTPEKERKKQECYIIAILSD